MPRTPRHEGVSAAAALAGRGCEYHWRLRLPRHRDFVGRIVMPRGYPLFEARGTHHELGRQHGEQCRDRLRAFVDYLGQILKLSRAQIQARALGFLPLFEKHCPQLVDEVGGLAEGANVPFPEALAVQMRGELGPMADEACTTFVISAGSAAAGQTLIGQNSDVEPELEELAYLLRLEPVGKPALLMWTFGGQIGYHGMNDAGVAHFANSLGGGPAWRFGLPHYPIKRMMLEQRTVGGVLDLLGRVPVCSSGNYVICDGEGRIADVELTLPRPHQPFPLRCACLRRQRRGQRSRFVSTPGAHPRAVR
jgi:predicted choloylglycine hydrolase